MGHGLLGATGKVWRFKWGRNELKPFVAAIATTCRIRILPFEIY